MKKFLMAAALCSALATPAAYADIADYPFVFLAWLMAGPVDPPTDIGAVIVHPIPPIR